ncbi:MAG: DUF3857 domain-containing protein [Bacteroidota bacterium]
MKKTLLLLGLCLLTGQVLIAQYDNYRHGRVSDEELNISEAPDDPDAEAYVLYDKLQVSMMISNTTGRYEPQRTVSRRVKLLDAASFDRANVVVGYYGSGNLKEIKASIHLPDGEEIKLRNPDFNHAEVRDDYYECRFSFPQITEGAIIEYTYTSEGGFGMDVLPAFYFQEDIPVRWAEYEVIIPQGLIYIDLASATTTEFAVEDTRTFSRSYGTGGQTIVYEAERYVIKDLPAIEQEPYTNNIGDYLPRIRKQLQFVNMPGFTYDPEMSSWEDLANDLMETELGRFTRSRTASRKVMDDLDPLLASATTQQEKAQILYRAINRHQSWDENYGIIPRRSPNSAWERGEGSAVENNTILLAALKQLDIEAYPLMVGLRGYGNPLEYYPLRTQFQHMLVIANLDGEYQLMDIGGTGLPFGSARTNALNHRAWLVDGLNSQWVSIEPERAERTMLAEIELGEDGMATASIQSRSKGYYAAHDRRDVQEATDPVDGPLMEKILERFPDASYLDRSLPTDDDLDGPFSYSLDVSAVLGQPLDDYIYVSPVLIDLVEQEIVDDEERTYPIDLPYGFRKRYITQLRIPDGYTVEDLPEPVSLRSEDNSVVCRFSASQSNQQISLSLDFQVNRTIFGAEEYGMFREMFRQVYDIQQTQLVLKRSSR